MLLEALDYPIPSSVSQIGVRDVCMTFMLRARNRDGEEISLVVNRYSYPCTEVGGHAYRGKTGFSKSHISSSNSLLG